MICLKIAAANGSAVTAHTIKPLLTEVLPRFEKIIISAAKASMIRKTIENVIIFLLRLNIRTALRILRRSHKADGDRLY